MWLLFIDYLYVNDNDYMLMNFNNFISYYPTDLHHTVVSYIFHIIR